MLFSVLVSPLLALFMISFCSGYATGSAHDIWETNGSALYFTRATTVDFALRVLTYSPFMTDAAALRQTASKSKNKQVEAVRKVS
ncbi:hypothetical protein J3R30DRAFT_166211 [Lentinula aciculospora]|uniref:Secreted protein n=1 Tax=Lentinula aciculospora TaxID=153920 RepID=A0A9W9AUN3_9AGAR|nr:hypothetical protein J3R30DRAFT_166211 [Lentinula aciculospora]